MTIGEVTFVAVKTAVNNFSSEYAKLVWQSMREAERQGWETAARVIQSYYETGIPGAR